MIIVIKLIIVRVTLAFYDFVEVKLSANASSYNSRYLQIQKKKKEKRIAESHETAQSRDRL